MLKSHGIRRTSGTNHINSLVFLRGGCRKEGERGGRKEAERGGRKEGRRGSRKELARGGTKGGRAKGKGGCKNEIENFKE